MPAALTAYHKKRDLKQSGEPVGKVKSPAGKDQLSFVVQRHDASRLHYDFRLELKGTLKSWAVPKGPSLNPSDKRLAVMVEDHPLAYRDFYGTIPEGNYGAGEVEIWDDGFYFPINEQHQQISQDEAVKNLAAGEIKILVAGTHLKGEFVLVRLKKEENNWLLIKHKDEFSVDKDYDIESIASIKKKKHRKKTGSLEKKAARKQVKKAAKKVAPKKRAPKKAPVKKEKSSKATVKKKAIAESTGPRNKPAVIKNTGIKNIRPMLAYTASEPFNDKDWLFEYKWDGYRAIAIKNGDEVALLSRNELSFNSKYPAVVNAIKDSINHDAVLDGEVVAMVNGKPSFQALQHAAAQKADLRFIIFDLLYLDGHSVMEFPLAGRKKLLKQLLQKANSPLLTYSEHIENNGKSFFSKIKKAGYEGVVAKKANSTYRLNVRSKDWLKIKNRNDREAIIVGYTKGTGSRKYFGALILAEKTSSQYQYIGHTGTGFTEAILREVYQKMQPLVTAQSPFPSKIKVNAPVTWIKPKLVCTVYFTETTKEGMLRHPVFAGLRPDKSITEINQIAPEVQPGAIKNAEAVMKVSNETTGGNQVLVIDKKKIPVTNLDKIYFPEKNITKGDVIAYYHAIAPYILPHLKNRPLSLKRNPDGIHGDSFFHKNAGEQAPAWVKSFESYSDSSKRTIDYVICNNLPSLVYLANLGCIEMNPWNATYKKPGHPTWLVIDLDPSEGNSFDQVIETALAVKEVTDKLKLDCYCKTSGASGLHIYLPLGNKYVYEVVKNFAELIAMAVHELVPEFTSLERSLKKRGKKIYVDFLQNRSNQTLASVYSLRPVEAATVSAPLDWKEVKQGLHPSQFTIFNIQERLNKTGDLFANVLTAKNNIKKAMKLLPH